ncbi:PID-CTERM protein-sorting domain-containing protein [Rufibacter sp. LB8]|uniref:PID-CTERM protein-sorting domain-containing protein n=1 Tax=Rufibacter sp. LB8 TaxID=2777781 RepID=UPI00178C7E9C|nr:hypothetical protein [Rufibacter sp. LB8]
MYKNLKTVLLSSILTVSLSSLPIEGTWAQGPGGGGPPTFEEQDPEEETPPPTGVPIDGGASLLLAAGAGYGLKKIRDSRKSRK